MYIYIYVISFGYISPCFALALTEADFEVPSMQPPSMELQVVAAFEETEGAAAAYGAFGERNGEP